MSKIVVADTGPLIALALIQQLPLLNALFSEVYVCDAVVEEATKDSGKPGAKAIAQALKEQRIARHTVALSKTYAHLVEQLDQGESESLALAEQLNAVALIDERRGRLFARQRGISITGTAAVLVKAKRAGEISAVKPLLERLTQGGYRLSNTLIMEVLSLVGENR